MFSWVIDRYSMGKKDSIFGKALIQWMPVFWLTDQGRSWLWTDVQLLSVMLPSTERFLLALSPTVTMVMSDTAMVSACQPFGSIHLLCRRTAAWDRVTSIVLGECLKQWPLEVNFCCFSACVKLTELLLIKRQAYFITALIYLLLFILIMQHKFALIGQISSENKTPVANKETKQVPWMKVVMMIIYTYLHFLILYFRTS